MSLSAHIRRYASSLTRPLGPYLYAGCSADLHSALGGPLEGWLVASKRLGPLPRMKWAALGRGCGSEGSGALLLARAAACHLISTG